MTNVVPFNPLARENLAANVAEALLTQPAILLNEIEPFLGAGIYAIYYSGNNAAYEDLTSRNPAGALTSPIYVGKAIPAGGRKGSVIAGVATSKALFNRLSEHADSIRAVEPSLSVSDFHVRHLVVDDIWIPLGESLLITRFAPVWNTLLDGFGNHDPGAGRYNGLRPRWDVLHPGRAWAERCKERGESAADIERDVRTYLRNAPMVPVVSNVVQLLNPSRGLPMAAEPAPADYRVSDPD